MKISRVAFVESSRRLTLFGILVFPVASAIGMLSGYLVGLPISWTVQYFVDGKFGIVSVFAPMVPVVAGAFFLPMGAMVLIDRRIGIRCPSCNVSLTLRCLPEKVLITRTCSHCRSTVLMDDDYVSSPPKSNPWVFAILFMLFALGIVVATALHLNAPTENRASTRDALFELGGPLIAFLAIGSIHSIVTRFMKRRWELDAADGDSAALAENVEPSSKGGPC